MEYLERIEAWARRTPGAPAIRTSEGEEMTYAELWRASEVIALRLEELDGSSAPAPVIVYGHKEPLMVACFLACMKSGRAYVPIDRHSVPAERAVSVANQLAGVSGEAPLVLAPGGSRTLPESFASVVFALDAAAAAAVPAGAGSGQTDPARWIAGEDLAYIIFTSGSTGAPKGVMVTASCFDNFCAWSLGLGGIDKTGLVYLDQAPFSFDLSVFELAGALASGGTLFSLTHDTQASAAHLLEALAGSGVAVWVSTPSFADLCLANREFSAELLPDLKLFLFCGETLVNGTAAALLEHFGRAHVLNTYGPTESTVAVTQVEVTPQMAAAHEPLPVGAARPGTRIRIVDEAGADRESGALGEIVIEGDTVAAGYFGRPDLTGCAFGSSELEGAPCRTYRTGDEGYLDQDGQLHYRGRLDLQVKLNGYRIELGEIEEHLRRLPQVKAACVTVAMREGRATHLVAHVVAQDEAFDGASAFRAGLAIKEALKLTLPHYMVPKKVVFLDALPMTGNGKVDRRALAAGAAR